MTSVVDTSVKFFRSDMVNAPVLSGTAGALISILDACLKDGFDLKTATSLVVADGVATLGFSGTHSALVDSVILVDGSSIAALNGEQKVTAVGANTVSFATAEADATATGTITFKMAAAGWLKPFSGTNLAAYKSSDLASTACVLRVDDTGTTVARVVGYESMSDINTGLGPFPTPAQMSGGGYWHKSFAANAVANNWVLIADGRFFILFIAQSSGSSGHMNGCTRGFGDIIPYRPGGDVYACSLSYGDSATTTNTTGCLDRDDDILHAMPRNHTGLGSAVRYVVRPFTGLSSAASGQDTSMGSFPSSVDGTLRLSKRFFSVTVLSEPRGEVPGLYSVPMTNVVDTFKWRDIAPGTGLLIGRNLMALSPAPGGTTQSADTQAGTSFVDITGPWR